VLGRIVKDDAMGWVRQKSSTAFHRSQNTGFPFDAQVDVQIRFIGHIADQGFGLMRIEIVHDEMPLSDRRIRLNGAPDMSEKIVLGARRASRDLPYRASGDMKVDDKRQGCGG
jgi:hypothetical protein